MEGKFRFLGLTICVLFVFMLAGKNVAQTVGGGGGGRNLYACSGGCYNQCFLLQRNAGNYFPCYFTCLGSCVNPTAPATTAQATTGRNYPIYCQIGCSSQLCTPLASLGNGPVLESCLGNCGRACGAN